MREEKQIKELANNIKRLDEVPYIPNSTYNFRRASKLYSMGYRKASDVAREIFEEIEKFTYRYLNDADYSGGDLIYDIDELKEKYTKGGNV